MKLKKYSLILCLFILLGCASEPSEAKRGMMHWDEITDKTMQEELFFDMKQHQINVLYQYYHSTNSQNIESLVDTAHKENVDVYYLMGEADYALEENYEKLLSQLQSIVSTIEASENKDVVKGILLDVEPYLLDTWNEDKDTIMESYVQNMKLAYQFAKEHRLEFILCIPYYYDSMGYSKQLETLAKYASDGFAIMNYYRENEAKHIAYEVSLCQENKTQCINIYEFKKPGEHALKEINTYYSLGFDVANESFDKLQKEFEGNLDVCFHDYTALKEVWDNE